MTDEQGEAVPAKVLRPGDFRFACVACRSELILQSAGDYSIANRLIGALGWRVVARVAGDDRSRTGPVCPRCVPAPAAVEQQAPSEPIAAVA